MLRRMKRLGALAGAVLVLGLSASPAEASYWRTCEPVDVVVSGTMLTHGIGCTRARGVIYRILEKSQTAQSPTVRAKGFACRLRPDAERAIRCQRGDQRILSPLAG
jgi:hypothetical protein